MAAIYWGRKELSELLLSFLDPEQWPEEKWSPRTEEDMYKHIRLMESLRGISKERSAITYAYQG